MSTTNNLHQASFRGIPFFEESSSMPTGRRLAVKPLPSRDNPYIADLGRKDRTFSINGRVIGDDYIDQIRALQAASEVDGPGEYVNTYMGRKTVSVDNFSPTIVDSETRVAKFTFTFVEYSESENKPVSLIDTRAKASVAIDVLQSTSDGEFVQKYDVRNKPQYIIAKVLSDSRVAIGKIKEKLFFLNSIDTFSSIFSELESEMGSLIASPITLATKISSLLSIRSDDVSGTQLIDDFIELFESIEITLTVETILFVSPIGSTETEVITINNDHFNTYLKTIIINAISAIILETEFETYDDAILYSEKITTAIESIESVVSDEIYESLYRLKSAINGYVSTTFIDYPRVTTVQLSESTPAIVLSYQLYGNIDMADEILKRNKLLHPGFIPAGCPVKVVSNE